MAKLKQCLGSRIVLKHFPLPHWIQQSLVLRSFSNHRNILRTDLNNLEQIKLWSWFSSSLLYYLCCYRAVHKNWRLSPGTYISSQKHDVPCGTYFLFLAHSLCGLHLGSHWNPNWTMSWAHIWWWPCFKQEGWNKWPLEFNNSTVLFLCFYICMFFTYCAWKYAP